jgi:DNA-binding NarL/FixJ family response regulator
LINHAVSDEATRRWLSDVLRNARDEQIASRLGLTARRKSGDVREALSKRETEVLDLVAQGLTNPQIANVLWISEGTVKVHVRHIFEKLGARTRVEAAMKADTLRDIL